MKILKFGIRFWITVASVLSFMGGWVMLVHAPKPYQLFQQSATIQTLEPLPLLSDYANNTSIQNQMSFNSSQPRRSFFKTGGS